MHVDSKSPTEKKLICMHCLRSSCCPFLGAVVCPVIGQVLQLPVALLQQVAKLAGLVRGHSCIDEQLQCPLQPFGVILTKVGGVPMHQRCQLKKEECNEEMECELKIITIRNHQRKEINGENNYEGSFRALVILEKRPNMAVHK